MKTKYEKPIARDLGDLLAEAQGVCRNGSNANTGQPNLTNNCRAGGLASGAGCGYGDAPNTIGCTVGLHPQYFGCGAGLDAIAPCITGDGVV